MVLQDFVRFMLKLVVAIAAFMSFLMPATAQAPTLAMLNNLDKGQWELRYRDGSASRKICVRTGKELIQLQHPSSSCNHIVVEDASQNVTVQYTCRGNGYGRTNIRRESAALVQIQAQGIAGGRPFEFSAEARQIGACR